MIMGFIFENLIEEVFTDGKIGVAASLFARIIAKA
jgi:hypothetical protein